MKKKGDVRIPDNIREQVKIMAIQGHTNTYISKGLNISQTAVFQIKKEIDNYDELRRNKKEEIIKKLWDIAKNALESITDKKLKESSGYQLMTIAAIAVDKSQLLSGEATDRLALVDEKELDRKLNELEIAEKELQAAWERARKEREKVAELPASERNETIT